MAKELFITRWFSQEMLLAGKTLIKRLDESDAQVQAAFWLLEDEEKNWQLIIVSPLVKSAGPRNYYQRINGLNESANSEEEVVSLHDIHVAKASNRIVKAILGIRDTALWDGIPWLNTRLGKNFINGVYFEDLYIYRMDREPLARHASDTVKQAA
ncbi:hypothetical protein KFZ76_08925 [Methylovulum psychrotolerans]|uniref:hypothetical protein n=1 Tax=Methylovulum psychrotolerans TaxID=1704499 RepID=UPI001BFF073D|nr:hypothetical protein [Methylovulum psychrotolerans]MBT9097829.1 hypothetical protein [Methylovulum psychrotolerans]